MIAAAEGGLNLDENFHAIVKVSGKRGPNRLPSLVQCIHAPAEHSAQKHSRSEATIVLIS